MKSFAAEIAIAAAPETVWSVLVDTPAGRASTSTGSRFAVREEFSGPMLGLIEKSLPDMTEPFAALCAGLKNTAEAKR